MYPTCMTWNESYQNIVTRPLSRNGWEKPFQITWVFKLCPHNCRFKHRGETEKYPYDCRLDICAEGARMHRQTPQVAPCFLIPSCGFSRLHQQNQRKTGHDRTENTSTIASNEIIHELSSRKAYAYHKIGEHQLHNCLFPAESRVEVDIFNNRMNCF